jgi:hypothetical protein
MRVPTPTRLLRRKRAMMIGQLDLRIVPDRDREHGGIQFNPSIIGIAGAPMLGGIGSNRSAAKEALGSKISELVLPANLETVHKSVRPSRGMEFHGQIA